MLVIREVMNVCTLIYTSLQWQVSKLNMWFLKALPVSSWQFSSMLACRSARERLLFWMELLLCHLSDLLMLMLFLILLFMRWAAATLAVAAATLAVATATDPQTALAAVEQQCSWLRNQHWSTRVESESKQNFCEPCSKQNFVTSRASARSNLVIWSPPHFLIM